ncbi:putative prolyl 4-hydroxylase 9 [Vitis vinifera]|uniref:Putative prolyl 4-hydroxylase 9 n=1 Tax=Vitis vinifera TaxID=29760 RepID=A0A438GJS1_VITVI|nr:putative prolyl 4-hydroxylase 9 [Vitis vinifera]
MSRILGVLMDLGVWQQFSTFISASEDKTGILDFVERKIAKATMIQEAMERFFASRDMNRNCFQASAALSLPGHAFNILRYEIGQRYNSHYDAFNPAEYGPQTSQRVASFLLYLSDVEEGGETMFPFEHDLNIGTGYDYKKCIGLKVKPQRGDGLLFYSVFPNGLLIGQCINDASNKLNRPMNYQKILTSLHGSCPVIAGEKWVATKWIRDEQQDD